MLKSEIAFIKANSDACKTLVIDTIDWAEQLAVSYVCSQHQKNGIEDFGWGKGYTYVQEEIGRLLNSLSELVDIGINVVLTAHAQIKKFEQPDEMGAYDRYELKLGQKTSSKTAPLVKEWADMVLFANYKTLVMTTDDGKKKAQGGERVIYTNHRPAWDAKNRHGLPDQLPFNFGSIAHIFNNPAPQAQVQPEITETLNAIADDIKQERESAKQPQPQPKTTSLLPQALIDLMTPHNVTESELQDVAYIRGHFPMGTPIENFPSNYWDMIVANWDATLDVIQNQVRTTPEMPFNTNNL